MSASKNSKSIIIKFIVLILFFISIILIAVKMTPWVIDLSKNPTDVREYMLSMGMFGGALFFLIQLIHVIIAVIPGDLLYVLGGYVFGLPIGFLLSYFGVMVGSVIVFSLARLLGYDFVNTFIPKDKLDKVSHVLNSTKGLFGLFVLCLIPIIPKDPLMYAAGLTPIKASKLFFVYALSRIPVTFMWVTLGASAYDKNYMNTIIMIIVLFILALISFVIKKKFMGKNKNE